MTPTDRHGHPARTAGAPPLIDNQDGHDRAGLVALLFAVLSLALTVGVELETMWWLDNAVLAWVRSSRIPALTAVMLTISQLSSEYATPVVIVISALLMARRSRVWPLHFLVMAVTSTGWQIVLKHFLARPRPQPPLVPFWSGAGYPSGHVLTALCIALAWLLWLRQHPLRIAPARLTALRAALVAWPILVGLSRVYIDAHWATDVIGGCTLGAMHFFAWLWLDGRRLAADRSRSDAMAGG